MEVYVARVPLSYDIVACATTQGAAERAALTQAMLFLQDAGWYHEFKNPFDVLEWHGVITTRLEVNGPARFDGDI